MADYGHPCWRVPRGFLTSDTSSSLTVSPLRQFFGDPAELGVGELIGTLGIILETRQRERLNGVVEASGGGKLRIGVQQSFSGCPKYIQGLHLGFWALRFRVLETFNIQISWGHMRLWMLK